MVVAVPPKIRIGYTPITSHKCYHVSQILAVIVFTDVTDVLTVVVIMFSSKRCRYAVTVPIDSSSLFLCGTKSAWYCGHFWPIVQAPGDRRGWLWRNWWNEDWQGKPKYSEKTYPSASLSTTNPTWPDPGSNPGRRSGKPVTNRLNYGAAYI
jgi:hypothetical protein